MDLSIAQALEHGVTAHKEGKLQKAEKLYRAILQSQPKHPDANHNLGLIAVGVGMVEGAIPHFKAALAANAKIEQYWLSYIDALIKLNQMDTAKVVLEQARSSGLQGEKFDNLESRLTNGDVSSLAVELDELIALYRQGKYPEALNKGALLSEQYPDDPNIPNLLGVVNAALQDYEEAITHYNKAIKLKPDYAEAYSNLGSSLKELKKFKEAIIIFDKSIKIKPKLAEAYGNRGNCLNGLGKFSEAISSLKIAIRIKPYVADFQNSLGVSLNNLSRNTCALKSFKRAAVLNPDYVQTYNNLGSTLNKTGRPIETIKNSKRAIILDTSYLDAYKVLGVASLEIEFTQKAIVNFKKVICMKPDDTEAYKHVAVAFGRMGWLDTKIISCQKAVKINPDYADIYNTLGITFYEKALLETAIQNYNNALRLDANLTDAWNNIYFPIKALIEENKTYQRALSDLEDNLPVTPPCVEIDVLKYQLNKGGKFASQHLKGALKSFGKFSNLEIRNPNGHDSKNFIKTPKANIFALKHFGRSGTGLLHSLIDNHSEITTIPSIYLSEFFHHSTWKQLIKGGWNELVDNFISLYPVLFDSRASQPVRTKGGQKIGDIGIKEGMTKVGEKGDEHLSINKNQFRASLIRQLSLCEKADPFVFFKLVHFAYEEALNNSYREKTIFYHIHNPDTYTTLNFINLAPEARWIVMVREPVQSCESWIRQPFNASNYEQVAGRIATMLFDIDDPAMNAQNAKGIRLEDLKLEPKRVIAALCDWMNIKHEDSLYEMTAQNKKWWGDQSTSSSHTAFSLSPIKRQVGDIFSDKDQYILKTLFYPFCAKFRYVDEDLSQFKVDLQEIRPMIDQAFDFEKKIAASKQICLDEFSKSGNYLYLRAALLDRWNVLEDCLTYPEMFDPLIVPVP